ncbi:MAG: winged helix-turn-helix domain-containing protein, partial [Acidobacteriaceae bacterium]
MAKTVSSFELTLSRPRTKQTLTHWLYAELRAAILDGRLGTGARLPASRDFANQYGLSRGTVVSVFERLQAEGYISCRVGVGTWVNRVSAPSPTRAVTKLPAYIRHVVSAYVRPQPFVDLAFTKGIRPFRIGVLAFILFGIGQQLLLMSPAV